VGLRLFLARWLAGELPWPVAHGVDVPPISREELPAENIEVPRSTLPVVRDLPFVLPVCPGEKWGAAFSAVAVLGVDVAPVGFPSSGRLPTELQTPTGGSLAFGLDIPAASSVERLPAADVVVLSRDKWGFSPIAHRSCSGAFGLPQAASLPLGFPRRRPRSIPLRLRHGAVSGGDLYGLGPPLVDAHNQVVAAIENGLKFIGEADRGDDALRALGASIRDMIGRLGARRGTRHLWGRCPGAAALFLVQSAVYGYSHGDYWEALRAWAGLGDASTQSIWGRRFLLFLEVFGLPMLPESEARVRRHVRGVYVGPIAFHAMIPNDCLPGFFDELLEPAVRSDALAGLGPRELLGEWLRSATALEQPLESFLRHGGAAAERFVAGALHMAQLRYESHDEPSYEGVDLAGRVITCYKEWCEASGSARFHQRVRKPVLRFEPSLGVEIELPEETMPSGGDVPLATWTVTVPARRPRDIRVPTRRSEGGLRSSRDACGVPPGGPYEVTLNFGGKALGKWVLRGIEADVACLAFSSRDLRCVDQTKPLPREPMWLVLPTNSKIDLQPATAHAVVARDSADLSGEWYGYRAVLVNFATVSRASVTVDETTSILPVEGEDLRVTLSGGNLLQRSHFAVDGVEVYGKRPPSLRLSSGTDGRPPSLEDITLGGVIRSPAGRQMLQPQSAADLAEGVEQGDDPLLLDLTRLFPGVDSAAELVVKVWRGVRLFRELRLRWLPGLRWSWSPGAGSIQVWLPEMTRITQVDAGPSMRMHEEALNPITITLGEDCHAVDMTLAMSWPGTGKVDIPMRLEGPRWALSTPTPTDGGLPTPVWHTSCIETARAELLQSEHAQLLFEARDESWVAAQMEARFMWPGAGVSQVLQLNDTGRHGRWQLLLGPAHDTLRRLAEHDAVIELLVRPYGRDQQAPEPLRLLRLRRLPVVPAGPEEPPPKRQPEPRPEIGAQELRELTDEILCCLSPNYWASPGDLAHDVGAPLELVRLAIAAAEERYEILPREGFYCVRHVTRHKIYSELRLWWKERHG